MSPATIALLLAVALVTVLVWRWLRRPPARGTPVFREVSRGPGGASRTPLRAMPGSAAQPPTDQGLRIDTRAPGFTPATARSTRDPRGRCFRTGSPVALCACPRHGGAS